MAMLSIIALMFAMLGMSLFFSGDEDLSDDELQEPEIDPEIEPQPDTEELPEEEDDETPDIGGTFLETNDGVTLEVGDDETGSLAVIYYTDTEDNSEGWLQVDEARFYLVPEGVDWSEASWETRDDVPGAEESGDAWNFELEDFEAYFELELLGVVNLMGVPSESGDPASRVGEINANAPVDGYYLEANTDGDDLISFLPEDYVVTRNDVPETRVVEDTIGSDTDDWLTTFVAGITVDGARGDDVIGSYGEDVTLIGGEGNDTIEAYTNNITIDAGSGDDSVRAYNGVTGIAVDLGSGDDYANINGGTVNGGDGADVLYGSGYNLGSAEDPTVVLFGDEGDDLVTVYADGPDDHAFGGEGNDTVSAYSGGIADGGAGDDLVQVGTGSQAFGGDGNDFISVYNGVSEDEGPANLTGGAGQDTFEASILNFGGEDEGVFAVITDFDPDEDVLIVNHRDGNAQFTDLENVTLITAEDGSFTDVQLEYTSIRDGDRGIAIVRLNGVTDLTLAQISILT